MSVTVEISSKTARELYAEIKANPARKRFGFGSKAALVNIDFQNAYTNLAEFSSAYETDPRQIEHTNTLAKIMRGLGWPVIWTYVAYSPSGDDCGVWGTRTNTPDSLQNIKHGSRRAAFDQRVELVPDTDLVYCKRMPSAFFETPLASLLVWHKIDTLIVTGGSTSGCVRATVVDSVSHGYRTIVPEECVADKHESYHFANLTDMLIKYADVVPVAEVQAYLSR